MMKQILLLLIVLGVCFNTFAQDDVWGTDDDDTTTNVLIVPLNADFYFSDSDHDFQKANQIDPKTIPGKWREALDFNLQAQLMSSCEVEMMLSDTSKDVHKDIKAIYGGLKYSYQIPTPVLKGKEKVSFKNVKDKVKDKLDERKEIETTSDGEVTTQLGKRQKTDQYMDGRVIRNEMVYYYADKYKVDLILFVNQLDVKTILVEQQDKWAKKYTRQVWVHFNVYDKQANMIWGDVVKIDFNSNSDNLDKIIRNTLPLAAEYIGGIIQ